MAFKGKMNLLIITTVYVRWTGKQAAVFFGENSQRELGKRKRPWLRRRAEGVGLSLLLFVTVPALFHRSCGKACGKAALGSYKFLKILYF
jgi:hypothetical protein